MSNKTLIIAEDDESIRLVTSRYLQDLGYEIFMATNLKELWKLIESNKGDVLITDVMLPDGELFDILPQIVEYRENLPVIVVSAKNNLQTAISATRQGAYEYLPKPFDLDELQKLIKKALESKQNLKNKTKIRNESEKQLIVGRSPAMQDLYKSIARLSQNDLTVMIYGESGTGKELVAKALHKYSTRSEKPFIAINMAAIPNDLIESELFGHEKGSFTGAHQKSDGKFKLAEKGTLFLDEIGDMPIDAQTRLLRVLQEGEFTPIGGKEKIQADTRIIAATHKNLSNLIEKGEFREDLFYRLNVVPISIPPLRERKEDIPELVNHFLDKAKDLQLEPKKFTTESFQILEKYQWPGNVRELENTLERVVLIHDKPIIQKDDIKYILDENSQSFNHIVRDESGTAKKESIPIPIASKSEFKETVESVGSKIDTSSIKTLKELECEAIEAALDRNNWNMTTASQQLGISRMTLYRKLDQHGLRKSN